MKLARPDWQALNAYVDGELSAADAAAVAEAAGEHRGVADEIALLYRLKGASHSSAGEIPADLHSLLPARRRPRGALAALAVAAVLALCVGLWTLHAFPDRPGLPAAALSTARLLHGEWLERDEGAASMDVPPARVLVALSAFGQAPVIPDLAATGLAIEHFTDRDTGDGRVLQIGFRGHHGCHLSMFVFGHGAMPHSAVRVVDGRELAYGWQVRDLGYLLFAVGMDPGRFDLISREVESATRANQPLTGEDRERLAQNRRQAASCKA